MSKQPAIPRGRALTARQVSDTLAASPTAAPDPEISHIALAQAYRLGDDSELLVYETGKGILYSSRTELLASVTRTSQAEPASAVAGLLPQGREFGGQASRLAGELGAETLTGLDDVVNRLGSQACLRPPVFGQLIAYAGEAIRHAYGGGWQMRLADDGMTWEPWLIDGTGQEHAPFIIVYKELSCWDEASSLTGALSGYLAMPPRQPR